VFHQEAGHQGQGTANLAKYMDAVIKVSQLVGQVTAYKVELTACAVPMLDQTHA
jgi:hypothetical protein